ncbi:MAG: extracellular solute-binding protein [Acholeplasma sp.]|nr:extracellular solute-binding protein [Acholeplasma sp.]
MRSKKKLIIILTVLVISIVTISLLTGSKNIYEPNNEISKSEIDTAFDLLGKMVKENKINRYTYTEFLEDNSSKIKYDLDNIDAYLDEDDGYDSQIGSNFLTLVSDDIAKYTIDIDQAGFYYIGLNYRVDEVTLNDITVSVTINNKTLYDEMSSIIIPLYWQDETKEYQTDRYGDEVISNQKLIPGWKKTSLYNNTYLSVDPLLFYFEKGEQTIRITNTSSTSILVSDIELISPYKYLTYEEYNNKNIDLKVKDLINIEATDYVSKNSTYVKSYALGTPSVTPFNASYKKLNVIDGTTYKTSGQEVTYEFEVKKAGKYQLAIHYINDKNDFSVLRSIYIDGVIPFEEFREYAFPQTNGQTVTIEKLKDDKDNPYYVYLEKGIHTITLKAESESMQSSLRIIQQMVDHINAFTLAIKKITGKSVDKDRSWIFTEYIPETPDYLEAYEVLIKTVITNLEKYSSKGASSATLSNLQKALSRLKKIYDDYDRLPLYLEDLSGGSGSIAQYLGDSLTQISEQPLYLDAIYVYDDTKLPKERANFFVSSWATIKTFFSSFSSKKYSLTKDEEVVDVWVNRSITYVDMMQKLVDKEFTTKTGIKVKISVMPDANKLVMSAAANQEPDVALGLASYMPYDLAIRNSAYDLSSFPDYWEFASQFSAGAFIPYILNEKAYAIPETLDFNVVMYRKDIFDSLGFMVPDTWEEVIQILPELQQYGMNFYHPIAGGSSTKYFYQTSGFVYQFGGSLYYEDGLKTSIDTKESIKGLTFLNQLMTNYSLPEQVQSFYNSFRYATLPIGISDFTNYQLIKNAAPEIAGQWEIAPFPSVTVNGETNRYYIANGTAAMIMGKTEKANESWEFLKWWLGEDTQTQFAFNIQSTYGPTYTWLSGNISAFKNSPLPEKDKKIIIEQVKWLIDAPRTPGQYMLERSLSDIWNTVVFEGSSTGVAVDKYKIQVDREIRKKMIEFGFISEDGEVIKTYKIPTIAWIKDKMNIATGGNYDEDN